MRCDDGTCYFENSHDEELYHAMLKASKITGRFYRNSGPCDILSDALETREPPSRARGIGVMSHTRGLSHSAKKRGSAWKKRGVN